MYDINFRVSIKRMRIKNLNNTAFSLLEILLSTVIFVIAIAGIFATLNAVRTPVANKEYALTAAVFSKQVLETLRNTVNDASSANFYKVCPTSSPYCATFDLELGTHQVSSSTLATVGLSWPPALVALNNSCDTHGCLIYTVSCADGSAPSCANTAIAHQVNLKICSDTTC